MLVSNKIPHFFELTVPRTPPPPKMVESGKRLFEFNLARSLICLPNVIVLAYLEVPKLAKPGQTDRQTDRISGRYMSLGKYQMP